MLNSFELEQTTYLNLKKGIFGTVPDVAGANHIYSATYTGSIHSH